MHAIYTKYKNISILLSRGCTILVLALITLVAVSAVAPQAASAAPVHAPVFMAQTGPVNSTPNPNQTTACPRGACIIERYINPGIKVLAALAGILVALSIIFAGIQYTMSADDPQAVTAAKQRIFKSIMALIAFFFLAAFLNWAIPGGIGFTSNGTGTP